MVNMKKALCSLCVCLFGLVFLMGSAAFADEETYFLRDQRVYRVYPDGTEDFLEEETPGFWATENGIYSWIVVDPEFSDAMQGSESGIYFFDEQENPRGFLSLKGAAYCNVIFSPDGERFILSCGTDASQNFILYTLEDMEQKASFRGIGSPVWVDLARFAFTQDDAAKGSRGEALDQQEGWLSVMFYDVFMEELFPLAEATETRDYMLIGVETEDETLRILERFVEDPENWEHPETIEDREMVVPIPAAG